MSGLETQLQALATEATAAIAAVSELDELEQQRVAYLGKKGKLSEILRGMGKLSAEERPKIGAIANDVKTAIQTDLEEKRDRLAQAQIAAQLAAETLDVTMPGVAAPLGRIHPLNRANSRE